MVAGSPGVRERRVSWAGGGALLERRGAVVRRLRLRHVGVRPAEALGEARGAGAGRPGERGGAEHVERGRVGVVELPGAVG